MKGDLRCRVCGLYEYVGVELIKPSARNGTAFVCCQCINEIHHVWCATGTAEDWKRNGYPPALSVVPHCTIEKNPPEENNDDSKQR